MRGRITGVRDCGTVVLVWCKDKEGKSHSISFDHRMFKHMFEGRNRDLSGEVEFNRDSIHFVKDSEEYGLGTRAKY